MIELIKANRPIKGFAVIVDINSFTLIVSKGETNNHPIAQFVRDILSKSITAIESAGGLVVGFMGDALLAILPEPKSVVEACIGIAVDVDKVNDYFNSEPETFPVGKRGLKMKIGIEYGIIDVSDIGSSFLGSQKLFIGTPINYAARISNGGNKVNNRCLFGPAASEQGMNGWSCDGPYYLKGKRGEDKYCYYNLDLDDIWCNEKGETSWR